MFPAPKAVTGDEKMARTKIVEQTRVSEGVVMAMLTVLLVDCRWAAGKNEEEAYVKLDL